jgi:hypothetical protein
MPRLEYPRKPDEITSALAKEILGGRFIADHKAYNNMLASLRERKIDVQYAFFGECSKYAIPVVEAVADENLRLAPFNAIERKMNALKRKIGSSVAASHARIDINRLGGSGAAGRQRDQARAGEVRNINRMLLQRLEAEIRRRQSNDGSMLLSCS